MAELDLRPEVKQEKREYTVQEIFRLAEKFRHLAKNLNEVFIQSSRQGLIYQIQTDPEEEELKEELGFVAGLSKRLKNRIQRKEFKKLTLVRAETPAPQVEKKLANKSEPIRKEVVQTTSAVVTPQQLKSEPFKEEAKPPPPVAGSLLDAARGFNSQNQVSEKPIKEASVESSVEAISSINPLQLSSDELPKYKKYADIAQQLLESRQIPDYKTLVEMAKKELSPLGIQLLEELGKKAGY